MMTHHLGLMSEDMRHMLPLIREADLADANVLRAASYEGASSSGGVADPTARAALSMRRDRGRSQRREAREALVQASALMAKARACLEEAAT